MLRLGTFQKILPISQIPAKCNEILLRSGKFCQMLYQVSPFLLLIGQFLPHLSSKQNSKVGYQFLVPMWTSNIEINAYFDINILQARRSVL